MKKILFSYLFIIIGAIVAAFAIEKFLVPSNILDGGMVGVSIIISNLSGFNLSILTILCNLPFVIIGTRQFGKSFLFRTLVGMVVFSVFLELFSKWNYEATADALLSTVFGGVLLGAGVGLIIRNGGCLDGTESVAMIISKKLNLSVGQIVLFFNIIIYLSAGFLFGLDRALYSLLTYFITSKVVDFINVGMDQGKAAMIITKEGRAIADDIYATLGRTVTFINSEGYVSKEGNQVLYCVVTRSEVAALRKIIEKDDYSAFMTISDVSEIVGRHIKSKSS